MGVDVAPLWAGLSRCILEFLSPVHLFSDIFFFLIV